MNNSTVLPHGVMGRLTLLLMAIAVVMTAYLSLGAKTAQAVTLATDPVTVDFGDVTVGTTSGERLITITNTEAGPLTITGVTIAGANPGDFQLAQDVLDRLLAGGITLAAGESATLGVSFSPMALDTRLATVEFTSTIPIKSTTLRGNGVADAATNTSPTITKIRPVPRSKIMDSTPRIAATVRDRQTNLAKSNIKLFVDGKRIRTFRYNRSTDRLMYTSTKLRLGKHVVKIIARDAAGAKTVKRSTFKIVRTVRR